MLLENTKTDIAVRKIAEKDGQVLAESLGDLTERVTGEKVTEILKKQAKQIVVTLANADADQMLAVLYEKMREKSWQERSLRQKFQERILMLSFCRKK